VVLTGLSPSLPLRVSVVGISPLIALTLTNASVGTIHANDTTAINGQNQAQILNNSLTAPAGATTIALGGTLPATLSPGPGVTVYTFPASVTQGPGPVNSIAVTGTASSVVIFQIPGALTFTDVDVVLAGGILPGNVYWQVGTAVTVTNDDAVNRTFPGTVVLQAAGANITFTCSGAGSIAIGRQVALEGGVNVTDSGAGGLLSINYPVGGTGGPPGPTGPNACSGAERIYPSPATGPTSQISYCMDQPGTVIIRVYNAIGDIAAKINDTKTTIGSNSSTLNTGRLAPGVYFYFVEKHYGGGTVNKDAVMKFGVVH
jgi:hypothetical protein